MEKEELIRLLAELVKLKLEHLLFKQEMSIQLALINQSMNEVDALFVRLERHRK